MHRMDKFRVKLQSQSTEWTYGMQIEDGDTQLGEKPVAGCLGQWSVEAWQSPKTDEETTS